MESSAYPAADVIWRVLETAANRHVMSYVMGSGILTFTVSEDDEGKGRNIQDRPYSGHQLARDGPLPATTR